MNLKYLHFEDTMANLRDIAAFSSSARGLRFRLYVHFQLAVVASCTLIICAVEDQMFGRFALEKLKALSTLTVEVHFSSVTEHRYGSLTASREHTVPDFCLPS